MWGGFDGSSMVMGFLRRPHFELLRLWKCVGEGLKDCDITDLQYFMFEVLHMMCFLITIIIYFLSIDINLNNLTIN